MQCRKAPSTTTIWRRRRRAAGLPISATRIGPTPELLAHRLAITGDTRTAADFPLDTLLAWWRRGEREGVPEPLRRGIPDTEARAGWTYARLWYRVNGLPAASGSLLYQRMVPAGSRAIIPTDDDDERAESALRAARAALRECGATVFRDVERAAVLWSVALVFDATPHQARAQNQFVRDLRVGLQRLAEHFGDGRRADPTPR